MKPRIYYIIVVAQWVIAFVIDAVLGGFGLNVVKDSDTITTISMVETAYLVLSSTWIIREARSPQNRANLK